MKKLLLTLLCCLTMVANVVAQSTYDAMAPFGFATRTSRTDASNSAVYNITGGGAMTYDEALASSSKKVLTSDGTTAMDTEIKNAIKNYSVIIFDGSNNTDFWLNQYIAFDGLENKTLIGMNGARLCTKFYLTSEIHQMLNNYQWTTTSGTQKTGVKAGSTSSNSNQFGNLPNGQSVGEESEYLTRKALMEHLNDNDENFRKAGVFQFKNCENFIIRNLKFVGPGPCDVGGYDLMSMSTSSHFWVDHCEFTDGIDGNFDITNNSDFSTISWCTFAYTERAYAHMNTNLVGSSDSDGVVNNEGYYLNLTWAYNHWGNKCDQRMPMGRSGKIHMLNNYYTCTNNSSSINPRKNSEFYIEGNYFADGVKRVFSQTDAKAYQWISSGSRANVIASSGVSTPSSSGSVSIPYSYNNTLTAADVPTEVGKWAGATLFQSASAPTISISSDKNSVRQGGTITISSSCTGYPEPVVTWYSCVDGNKNGAQSLGTGASYNPVTTSAGTFYIYAVANNSEGSATSNVISYTVTENSDVVWNFNNVATGEISNSASGAALSVTGSDGSILGYYSTSGTSSTITEGTQTISDERYTNYLKMGGNGSTTNRYFLTPVLSGKGTLTIVYGGTVNGTCSIYKDGVSTALTTISPAALTAVTSSEIDLSSGSSALKIVHDGKCFVYSVIWTSSTSSSPTPQTYTIKYNLNGHGDAIADVTDVTALPSSLPMPTATGYSFNGWYTNNTLTTPATAGTAISANTTLYAKWTINSYTVKFMDGSEELSSQNVHYNSTASAPSAPTKAGYTFKGWSLTEDGSVVTFPYTVTAPTTFYAVWEKNQPEGGADDSGEFHTVSGAPETILLTKANITANAYLSTSTETWATGKNYGEISGDFYNMSSTDRKLTIKLSNCSKIVVNVQCSTKGRTYSYSINGGNAVTVTHGGSGVEATSEIVVPSGNVTITLAGLGNSVYPVSVVAYQREDSEFTTVVPEGTDDMTIYSWQSPSGTVIENGGKIEYLNGDGNRLNYENAGYHTICLNGKIANLDDAVASANAGYMLVTLNTALKAGDKIKITGYRNKNTNGISASVYMKFENGAKFTGYEGAKYWTNIYSDSSNQDYDDDGDTPNSFTWTVPVGEEGTKKIILTRNDSGTNLFITKLEITRDIPVYALSEDNNYNTFPEGKCTVKLKKTFPQDKWTSLVLPFSATTKQLMEAFPNNADNTEIAVIKEMRNNVVYFTTQARIDANVPVLIKVGDVSADNTYTFKDVTIVNSLAPNTANKNGIEMRGLYKKTSYDESPIYDDRQHVYFVSSSRFYDWSYLNSMPPFSAYIYTTEENSVGGAKGITFMLGDVPTGIYTVDMENGTDCPEYNIAGQRIDKTAKGLHIKNGKKYYIK